MLVIGLLASSLDIDMYNACIYYFLMDEITDKYFVFPPPTHIYLPEQLRWHHCDTQHLKFVLSDRMC